MARREAEGGHAKADATDLARRPGLGTGDFIFGDDADPDPDPGARLDGESGERGNTRELFCLVGEDCSTFTDPSCSPSRSFTSSAQSSLEVLALAYDIRLSSPPRPEGSTERGVSGNAEAETYRRLTGLLFPLEEADTALWE